MTLAPRNNDTVIATTALVRGVFDGRLTVADCRLLLCVRAVQALATTAVRFAAVPAIRRAFIAIRPLVLACRGAAPEARVLWAFAAIRRSSVGNARCLARALAAEVLLDPAAEPHRMVIGVSVTAPGVPKSHAWIERNGEVLLGGPESSATYVPIIDWSSGAR